MQHEIYTVEVPDEVSYCSFFDLSCKNYLEALEENNIQCDYPRDPSCLEKLVEKTGCNAVLVTSFGDVEDWHVILCPDKLDWENIKAAERWVEKTAELKNILYDYITSLAGSDEWLKGKYPRGLEKLVELYHTINNCYYQPSSCPFSINKIENMIKRFEAALAPA